MQRGHLEDHGLPGSQLDGLVLIVEVEPGPTFRIADVTGDPVAAGTVEADRARGVTIDTTLGADNTTMARLEAAWATRRLQRFDADRPDGRYEVFVAPMVEVDGRCPRLMIHVVDRQRHRDRRRNIVNAAIVDALPGSVALVDGDGVIRAVNAGWVRFGLERSNDGVLADAGTSYLEVTDRAAASDPSARDAAEAIRSVLAGNVDLATADYPADGADASEWFTVRVAAVDVDGERWAVVAHEDVTTLRLAVDRWHSTFSKAAVPTFIVDRRGRLIDANTAFAALLHVDLPGVIGRPAVELVHPADRDSLRRHLAPAAAGRTHATSVELRLECGDGSTAVAIAHPSSLMHGNQRGVVVQLVDLTPQRRAEARLELHRELLELVAAGTPLTEVAMAVAANIGRAIERATGAVLLAGKSPALAPDLRPPWLPFVGALAHDTDADSGAVPYRSAWSVEVPDLRGVGRAAVAVVSDHDRPPAPDDVRSAQMLASVVRLALQRDETSGPLTTALHDMRTALLEPALHGQPADDTAADDLRRGLAAGEVGVHYQPIIDLHSGAVVSLEALIRWQHPTRDFVPPPELIHVAEASGLIRQIGALVLTTACRDLAAWRANGAGPLSVAVNLSARQLADPELVGLVQSALGDAGLDASALVVEITESVVVDDLDQVVAALAELRRLGVRVAIDDFGTGYSSLLYLKRFPADVLKVDRSFVQGLGVHDGDTAIVDAVVELGHRLGLEVVAEGVETDEQLHELRRRRCDHAQGYLLQRPVPASEMDRFLEAGAVELGPEPAKSPSVSGQLEVDELLSHVTHELSTPLTVIGAHAELLADLVRVDDGRPAAVFDALERNIRNLDDLLRSLSGLGEALGGREPATSIDLNRFVAQTTDDLAPLLAQHEVRRHLTEQSIPVNVEPVALRQILTNILSNAVKFSQPGTTIEVAVARTSTCATVTVADHGPGIPRDREAELFGRFSRLGTSSRGLGLGLHLSRGLARRQGGDLVHARTPGGGATFVLELPG